MTCKWIFLKRKFSYNEINFLKKNTLCVCVPVCLAVCLLKVVISRVQNIIPFHGSSPPSKDMQQPISTRHFRISGHFKHRELSSIGKFQMKNSARDWWIAAQSPKLEICFEQALFITKFSFVFWLYSTPGLNPSPNLSSLHWLVSALKKLFFIQWSILDPSTAF